MRRMAAAGVPNREIARALGVAPRTLARRFRAELAGRAPGPAAVEPTAEQRESVKAMAGFGIPQEEIARVVRCDPSTLRERFREELDDGATAANVRVVQSLYNLAVGGNVAAAIYWTKARMGWRDRVTIDANISGIPAPVVVTYEEAAIRSAVASLSPEGRSGLRKALEELGARSAVIPGESDAVH